SRLSLFHASPTSQPYTLSLHDALPISASKEDIIQAKHRIQRQKAQDRKSFRLMKNQKSSDRNIIKSESIDNADELREQLNFNKRSEEHTSELQSRENLVCRLLLEKKK